MTILQLLFYAFSTVALSSGLMVIVAPNPVRSVLALVLTFFATAGVWILMHAEFLALILVLVYVGAVMTLFLFVVMMLSVHMKKRERFVRYAPFALLVVGLVLAITIFVMGPTHFGLAQVASPGLKGSDYSNVTELGIALYTHYAFPFEIAAVLLLTAIIAAISLAHRKPTRRRSQRIAEQVSARRNDFVQLIQMPSEKKHWPKTGGE